MSNINASLPLDLSYLYEISDHDRAFILEMIETIVKNTPQDLVEIKEASDDANWRELGRLLHKLKPSLLLLNIQDLSSLVRLCEKNAKGEINIEDIPHQVTELDKFCNLIINELNELIEKDLY